MADEEMATDQKLMMRAGLILQERGCLAVDLAKQIVLKERVEYAPLQEALRYFIEGWNDFFHPGLASLACEAVGGKPEMTAKVGGALVLLAGGADIHDDVIDESITKASEQTVFGKFGKDLAVLAADILLLEGVYLLHEACQNMEMCRKKTVLDLVKRSFLEISGAEAAEASMRGRIDIPKQQYLDIIHHKVAAGELAMRIGALIGEGDAEEVETLGEFGRVYGVLMSTRDEFIDLFELDELSNRMKKEILPLPLIVTLADESKRPRLLYLLSGKIAEDKIEEIVDLSTNSAESTLLISELKQMADLVKIKVRCLRYCKEELELLVLAALEDL